MIWMIREKFFKPKRRAHKSPPLIIVRAERDAAVQKVKHLRAELRAASEGNDEAWREITRLRQELARLRNAEPFFIPAPVDLGDPVVSTVQPIRGARVIPLHQAPMRRS